MKILSRTILVTMLVLAAALLAFGPRGKSQRPAGRTIVSYWEKWPGAEGRQMKLIVDSFNETVGKDKNIYVEYLSMSQVDRKTMIATAAGVPPDVAGLWDKDVVTLGDKNALEPLDDLAREFGITSETYKPVFRRMCTYRGKLFALVSAPATVALHYNRHAFLLAADRIRAAGFDPTQPPRTIAQLDAYAKALDRYDASGRLLRVGYLPMEPDWYVPYMPYWFGGRLWNPDTAEFYFTEPRTVAAFEWIQSYPRRLGKAALDEFSGQFSSQYGNFGSPTSPFITGQVVMMQQGPWMANYFYNLRPPMSEVVVAKSIEMFLPRAVREFNYEWAVAAFPSVDESLGDVTVAQSDVLMIPRRAKHKREAFEFIAYVQRQDVNERLNSMQCKPTALAYVSDDFIRRHPNPFVSVFDRLAWSTNAAPNVQSPMHAEINADLVATIQKLYFDATESSAPAVKTLMEMVSSEGARKFKDYRRQRRFRDGATNDTGATR